MKRSTWLFKKLPICINKSPSFYSNILVLSFTLILSSCQYLNRDGLPLASERINFRPLSIHESGKVVAHASEKGCSQGIPHFWLIEFHSAFGSYQIKLDYSNHQAGEDTLVIFNQHRFRAQIPLPVSGSQIHEICNQELMASRGSFLLPDPTSNTRFKTILETIAPNCQVELRDDGIYCHLEHYDANEALRKLTDAHRRLVHRMQRHPYLLSRRIAFARNLALAINDSEAQVKLDRICRIVKHSIPEELPLSTRSSRWFQAACLKADPINKEALLVSLYDAIHEIERLTEELSSSSRIGMFSVRIPPTLSPSREFWVTLKPLSIDHSDEDRPVMARSLACWHPLYDQSMTDLGIADELGLLAEPQSGACSPLAREDSDYLQTVAIHYVKNSIASETEFPLSNGRGKVLRLPKGEYHYTIETHHGPFVDIYYAEEGHSESSSGIISWSGSRPHPTISNW